MTMTPKEAKALIGRAIKYNRRSYSSYIHWRHAVVLDVKGKNVEIDEMGMRDWLWLPDVYIVPIASETEPTSGGD